MKLDVVYRPGQGLVQTGSAKPCPQSDGSAGKVAAPKSTTPAKKRPGLTPEEPSTASRTSANSVPGGTSAAASSTASVKPLAGTDAKLLADLLAKDKRRKVKNAAHQRAWRERQKMAKR